jgi:hypothetical protein
MAVLKRDTVQEWIQNAEYEAYVCPDCDGIHLTAWEERDGVLESRCFVEKDRISFVTEVAIRQSAVLPLQGAVHFMNYDYSFLKVMIAMADHDVPRVVLNHAVPSQNIGEAFFKEWFAGLLAEKEAVYKHLAEMDVLHIDDDVFLTDFDDNLH